MEKGIHSVARLQPREALYPFIHTHFRTLECLYLGNGLKLSSRLLSVESWVFVIYIVRKTSLQKILKEKYLVDCITTSRKYIVQ